MVERTPLTLAPDKLVEELRSVLGDDDPKGAVMAFDGDGTLWSGDVGENLFRQAVTERFFDDAARGALLEEAARYEIPIADPTASTTDVADALVAAYVAGRYPERQTCAMMTWCYAGRRLAELRDLADRALANEDISSRMTRELTPIIEFARSAGIRCVLISASPRVVVEVAGALWGFEPHDIAAATPLVVDGRVVPGMDGPVPYAEGKPTAGRALFGSARWLAAFGDNVFDIEMLQSAEVGVAVRPKPKLAREIPALGLRVLSTGDVQALPLE